MGIKETCDNIVALKMSVDDFIIESNVSIDSIGRRRYHSNKRSVINCDVIQVLCYGIIIHRSVAG